MSSILPTLGKDVSIDIGSIQTRLMGGTRGTVISEPSIIATDTKQEKVVAVGDEAARLVLRMPDMWRPLTPLKDGFIVDYRVMHTMLNYFLNKVVAQISIMHCYAMYVSVLGLSFLKKL